MLHVIPSFACNRNESERKESIPHFFNYSAVILCYDFSQPSSKIPTLRRPLPRFSSAAAAMAAASPTSFTLTLDSSLRPLLLSSPHFFSFSSLSLHCSNPLPLSLSYIHPPATTAAIAANASSSSPCGAFLDDLGLYRLQTLDKYISRAELGGGCLEIRHMGDGEVDSTVQLLSESFAESMGMPPRYVPLLAFLVRQYVVDRRFIVPHSAILVGFYCNRDREPELACTVEVSFDARGSNAAPPTPLPPSDCPYICNMVVKKELRRRHIGFHLLKACEDLISKMKTNNNVYLHCRVTDTGPLKMYKKAKYRIVKTDSILVWLTLQRRKHLLLKELDIMEEEETPASWIDTTPVGYHVNQ